MTIYKILWKFHTCRDAGCICIYIKKETTIHNVTWVQRGKVFLECLPERTVIWKESYVRRYVVLWKMKNTLIIIAANGGSISYWITWSFPQDSTQSCENVFHNIVHTGKFKQVVRFYNIDTLLSISKRLLSTKSILWKAPWYVIYKYRYKSWFLIRIVYNLFMVLFRSN